MPREFEDEVKAGIALLDAKGPPDWRDKINTATLDLMETDHCVLGQVYGDYGKGIDALIPDAFHGGENWQRKIAPFGFTTPPKARGEEPFWELTAEWRRQLIGTA